MRLILAVCLLTFSSHATPTNALTVADAQTCANELLDAYNERRFPKKFLAIESITQRAFGIVFRFFTPKERALAIDTGAKLLRESFEKPSGKYSYRNLVVEYTEPTNEGNFRIIGEVHITSPQYTGPGSFLALTTDTCKIFQVRIVDIATLDGRLREMLMEDPIGSQLMAKDID
jgi:hypothetical protein